MALSCGSPLAPHAGVAANITGGVAPGAGFILAAWVKPTDPGLAGTGTPGAPRPLPGPVLGLSGPPGSGGESTVLSYDATAARFVFSDSCTAAARADMSPAGVGADASARAGAGAAAAEIEYKEEEEEEEDGDPVLAAAAAPSGEWHYVAVVVEGGGRGAVVVNGATVLVFDTNAARPGVASAQLTLCAAAGATAAGAPRFRGLVDEAHVWVSDAVRVADAPEAVAAAMFAPGGDRGVGREAYARSDALRALGPPALRLHFNAGIRPGEAAPLAARAYTADTMLAASTGPWLAPVPLAVVPSEVFSTGVRRVDITAVNLAPSRWLTADLGQGEASVRLAAISDGYSVQTSTLAFDDGHSGGGLSDGGCGSVRVSTNGASAVAASTDAAAASLSFVPGGVDTARLYARFTFSEWGTNAARRSHFYDYSGSGRHARINPGVEVFILL